MKADRRLGSGVSRATNLSMFKVGGLPPPHYSQRVNTPTVKNATENRIFVKFNNEIFADWGNLKLLWKFSRIWPKSVKPRKLIPGKINHAKLRIDFSNGQLINSSG